MAKDNPILLVGHHYTRYLGDLSGGQILKGIAKKALKLKDDHASSSRLEIGKCGSISPNVVQGFHNPQVEPKSLRMHASLNSPGRKPRAC